jgi:membrane protein implicated in regulation of membrane protease activity
LRELCNGVYVTHICKCAEIIAPGFFLVVPVVVAVAVLVVVTEWADVAVTPVTIVGKVFGSDLGRDGGYPD